MVETYAHFITRLNLLGRKHEQMSHGYVTRIRSDGLIIVAPKRTQARVRVPVAGLAATLFCFFCFKAFLLAAVGPVTYAERLAKLENGTKIEQVGGWFLAMDPLTRKLAALSGPVLR
jgi:hypothetical protein